MPSTKRYFTVLAFGLVLSLCGTLTASNGHDKDKEDHDNKTLRTTFHGGFWMMNPCPGADPNFFFIPEADGTTLGLFRQNKNHAWVHFRYLGKGSDSVGQPVTAFVHGKAKVDAAKNLSALTPDTAASYEIPFESFWVDNNGAQSWTFSASAILFVDKTGIFAAAIDASNYKIQCTGPVDAHTPEHRFNHDNDEDDDRD